MKITLGSGTEHNKCYKFLLLFAISLIPLGTSFFSQYILDITPCHMCVLERWPYVFIFLFTLVLFLKPHLFRFILMLMIISSFIGFCLSVYHMGIEYSWWHGSEKCSGGSFVGSTAEELAAFLETVPVRRCDQSSKLFGTISFSSLNALYSVVIFLYYFISLKALHGRK